MCCVVYRTETRNRQTAVAVEEIPSDFTIEFAINIDMRDQSILLGDKVSTITKLSSLSAERTFKKMSILSQLSRRMQKTLTTNAKPDLNKIEDNPVSNEELSETQSKSAPSTLEKEPEDVDVSRRQQKSVQPTLKKMPIFSQLSRRFYDMLTTDAKADPPRIGVEGYTHNLPPTRHEKLRETQSESTPATTPEKEHVTASMHRQKSVPNDARPTTPTDFGKTKQEDLRFSRSTSESEHKRPKAKTKTKHAQGTSVVSYNIVNSNGVNIGSRTSYICNVNQYPTTQSEAASWSKPKYRPMPESVEELSTCDDELAFNDMLIIKTHVGHGWRDVARRLSYSDGQIEQFEENYRHKGIDEVIYQLLLDWKQANTRDAKLGILVSILWSCQEYDCVERLAATRSSSYN
ncbi:uncharacterized protein LOC109858091 isoform X2 [Pseudomyrmex gracilis]|uniref:uncharacterized protein LOC109858091 isoform X2 n=1 Tax=Pseudomyrmex gracilis TaxID=219809 RepID=UPI000995CB17|nr:uncharacterized protein LOC109858091 isoform X2 [Pseudomyrmex gracilis]